MRADHRRALRDAIVAQLFDNQFVEGPRTGEFGTTTDFLSRRDYHFLPNESVPSTPQMFLTYMGLSAMLYMGTPEARSRAELAANYAASLVKTGFVRIRPLFRSPERNDTNRVEEANFRHSALAYAVLLRYHEEPGIVEGFVRALIDGNVQDDSGGWPEWSGEPTTPRIISSVYVCHFLHEFVHAAAESAYKTVAEAAMERTLSFLASQHRGGLWREDGQDAEAAIRFYPTLYLLALPVLLHSKGADDPIIRDFPALMRRLADGSWIKVSDETKKVRTTVRYLSNLYLNTFVDRESVPLYRQLSRAILPGIAGHLQELNAHEILGLLLVCDNTRFDPHTRRRVSRLLSGRTLVTTMDWAAPLLRAVPVVGSALREYYDKLMHGRYGGSAN